MPASETDSEASFHSIENDDQHQASTWAPANSEQPTSTKPIPIERFPPEEEATLKAETNSLKGSGNTFFGCGSYENAIQTYDKALSSCPNYLDYELAVLRSNIAACHLKLEEWKEAVTSAEKGIDNLERLEPLPRPPPKPAKGETAKEEVEDDGVEEVDEEVEERIQRLQDSGRSLDEVRKLQVKLLLRRAKAKTELDGWANLQAAQEDYNTLLSPTVLPCLSTTDRRSIQDAVTKLGPRLNAAKDREMAEMMDKLKGFGNTMLKPFGLSTENFQFVQDEKTGGYSMNFDQNPGKK
ncbi:Tetratricopeptide repeat 1 [Lecanosticta acicola]|uniref:Tetratricopeptide repeat 1 n=1 Tax=Lecanosticta acicola TaxID=111012 RepID=A0AAI8Z2U2_9PEZI|nr:Tetratricopeptide repeat 1 [Lecanosticta acicola]